MTAPQYIERSHWVEAGAAPRAVERARLPIGFGGRRARGSVDTEGQIFGGLLTAAVRNPASAADTWRTSICDASSGSMRSVNSARGR